MTVGFIKNGPMAGGPFWVTGSDIFGVRLGALALRFARTKGLLDPSVVNDATLGKRFGSTKAEQVLNKAVFVDEIEPDGSIVLAFSRAGKTSNPNFPNKLDLKFQNVSGGAALPSVMHPMPIASGGSVFAHAGASLFAPYVAVPDVSLKNDWPNPVVGGLITGCTLISNESVYHMATYDAHFQDATMPIGGGDLEVSYSAMGASNPRVYPRVTCTFSSQSPTSVPVPNPQNVYPAPNPVVYYVPQRINFSTTGTARLHAKSVAACQTLFNINPTLTPNADIDTTSTLAVVPFARKPVYMPVGYLHGISDYVKQLRLGADGSATAHLMWTNAQARAVVTGIIAAAKAEDKAVWAQMLTWLDGNPDLMLRATVFSNAPKGVDIYSNSAIGDAMQAGADVGDVDAHVVSGKPLGEWRDIAKRTPDSFVWIGVTRVKRGYRRLNVVGYDSRTGKYEFTTDEAPIKGAVYVVDSASAGPIADAKYAADGGNTGVSGLMPPKPTELLTQATVFLTARGQGETVQEQSSTELSFVNAIDKPVLRPWDRRGDGWMQHVMAKQLAPLISGLVCAALEPSARVADPVPAPAPATP